VMRPGSVIGEQQHYLCEVDRLILRPEPYLSLPAVAAPQPQRAPASQPSCGVAVPAVYSRRSGAAAAVGPSPPSKLAAQVAAGMARRGAARVAADAAGLVKGRVTAA
jgi:hypothetical protein